jgi:medium-chain acyl-[acyl-carrier-protein] hydrolase
MTQWLTRYGGPPGEARFRLFCFPFAGASSAVYARWASFFRPAIEIRAIELPGRWRRIDEPTVGSVDAIVENVTQAMLPLLDLPYSVYGHSFGGLLAFECVRRVRRLGYPLPRFLAAGASKAPDLPLRQPPLHVLPDQDFLDSCARRYGGLDERLLEDVEMRAMITRSMRADLTALETYGHRAERPLTCPIMIFGARGDASVTGQDLDSWAQHTLGRFSIEHFDDGHLFHSAWARTLPARLREAIAAATEGDD